MAKRTKKPYGNVIRAVAERSASKGQSVVSYSNVPKDKIFSAYRPQDAHLFIKAGYTVIDQHPQGRYCKLAKIVTAQGKHDTIITVIEVHLKKFGPPSLTSLTKGDLMRMLHLVNMEEGVLEDGTPVQP